MTEQQKFTPQEAQNYWANVANSIAMIRADLEKSLPTAPDGMHGISEDSIRAMEEAFDEAALAADAALGLSTRLLNARQTGPVQRPPSRVRGVPQNQQSPQQYGTPATAGW